MGDFQCFKEHLMNGNVEGVRNNLRGGFVDKIVDDVNFPIHIACRNGFVAVVRLLLDRNCNIECENKWRMRPIHWTYSNGHSEILKLLLDRNCNVECEDHSGMRLIHLASSNGRSDILKLLLEHNCNIECENRWGERPIHLASSNGNTEILKLLLQQKSRIDCKNKCGKSPLDLAKQFNNVDCVELLTHVEKLFAIIARDDPIEIENLFISCNFIRQNIYTGLNVLEMAINNNAARIVKCILEKSVDNKMGDFQCFKEHLMKGNAEGVRNNLRGEFVDKIVDNDVNFPIHIACRNGFVAVVRLLLDRNCNVECEDKLGWRPIHYASSNGHSEILKLLLDRNCNVECESKSKMRPIHYASRNGHSDILKLLLDRNCNVECEDHSGMRPIHWASSNGHSEILKLLLDRNCNVESEDHSGMRLIHLASSNGRSDILKLLLDRNCNIECEDKRGERPIHLASSNGNTEILKLLLQRKCRIDCKNKCGKSPLDLAKQFNNVDCVELLTHVEKLFAIIARDDPIEIENLFISCNFIRQNIYTGLNVLEMAINNNAARIVKCILEKSVDNKLSCQHSVREIFEKPDLSNSNSHDGDHNSLFHLAVKCHNPHICSSLLNAVAQVYIVNNFENSPLLKLYSDRQIPVEDDTLEKLIDITKILITKGANVNFKSSNGITVFQSASNIESEKLMLALVSNRPRLINFSSNDFQTAFLNQWFIYAEVLIELLPDDFLSSTISNETFQSCESAGTNLIKSIFNKSSTPLQQSVIENLLYKAVNNDDVELFDHLIRTEILAPRSLGNDENLFTFILQERKIEFAWKLLDSVNRVKFVNLRNLNNQIPLQIAIEIEELDLVNALIIEKEFDSEDKGGKCALTQLLEKISISNNANFKRKLVSTIKIIISLGGDIYKMTSRGQRIIDACADIVDKEEIERFHRNNVKPSKEENQPMCNICQDNPVSIGFQCGHLTCNVCSNQLFECPYCKADIVSRTKMFFS